MLKVNIIDMGDKDQRASMEIISINLIEKISGLKRHVYVNYIPVHINYKKKEPTIIYCLANIFEIQR